MNPLLSSLFAAVALASVVPAQAPCSSQLQANYSAPLLSNYWEFQDVWKRCYLVENPHSYPIQICEAAQRLQHNLGLLPLIGEPNVFFSWVQAVPVGNNHIPGLALGSITPIMTIPYNQLTECRGTFAAPLTLQPGQKVFLVANYWIPPLTVGGDWISSTLTHGSTDVKSWFWKNGHWNQSLPNGYQYDLRYRPHLAANTSNLSGACGGNGIPSLSCTSPLMGSSSSLTLGNVQPGSLSFHMLGFTDPNVPLTVLGAPGCKARTTGDIFYPGVASGAGQLQQSVALPADPSVLGVTFYAQGLSIDPGANQLGISFSNGVAATIGSY